jgi:phosphoribosyl 1,2-cyclic phosphodiesterase
VIFSLKQEYPSRKYGRRWDLAFLLWLGRSYHTNIFDHAKAVKDLLKAGVDCFMSQECVEALKVEGHHRVHSIVSGKQFVINGFWIIPFSLEHDVITQGFVVSSPDGDSLVFIPDTCFVKNRFEGFTHLAIECNHLSDTLSEHIQGGNIPATVGRRIRHNHMSLETVIKTLRANDLSKCRHIYLLHLSDSNSDEARMIKAVQQATGVPCTACAE